jgi:LuxR family maltose regulon positive regulatory protein
MVDAINQLGPSEHGVERVPLLLTKLAVPPARSDLVVRLRLFERLNAGIAGKLTLVVAPPGFGKTTLLTNWLHHVRTERQPADSAALRNDQIAWFSLDKNDNRPALFWRYCVAALERLRPGIGEHTLALLAAPQLPSSEVVASTLLNEICATSDSIVLILDDCHLLVEPSIHTALDFLIEHAPPHFHLIMASRTEPPLALARLRVRGQLTELRSGDLRFTADEAAQFLNRVMGLGLVAQDIAALEQRTEGWIAALHLAALSLRGRTDVQQFIAAFAGSHRYLVDYLAEEVLARQTAEVQAFLLCTSTLDRMCASLCDAVLGVTTPEGWPLATEQAANQRSQTVLEELERANLFLSPLDDERRWYRYHHLFADFLRERLHRTSPDLVPKLHHKAAAWYEQHAETEGLPFVAAAVGHALAADDSEHAVRLVEVTARPLLLRGEATTVLDWLEALPDGLVRMRPQLCIYAAWSLAITGQIEAVESRLLDAEQGLEQHPEAARLAGEIAAVRATIAGLRRDLPRAIKLGRQALETLPADNLQVRSVVALILGTAYYLSGDAKAAKEVCEEAITAARSAGNVIIAIFAMRQLGELQVKQGQLRQALHTYQSAHRFVQERYPRSITHIDQPIPVAGTAYVGMGLVLYEWNDLETAARYLTDGVALGQQVENVEILLMGPIGLARTQQAQGDPLSAQETMARAVAFAEQTGVARLIDWMHAEQVRLWLIQGNGADAAAWADASDYQGQRYSLDDEPSYLRETDYLALAQTRIAQGRPGETLLLLERLRNAAEAQGRIGSVIEIDALQVLALAALERTDEALAILRRVLALAEPEGYVRTFVDLGAPMAALLRHAKSAGIAPHYTSRLLAAFAHPERQTPRVEVETAQHAALIEPLSEREGEVLQLIAQGLSNQEIANKLVIGLSTVKKHINNIYAKLDVKSRTQALVRGRELGLIETTPSKR